MSFNTDYGFSLLFQLVSALVLISASPLVPISPEISDRDFDWYSLKIAPNLRYNKCYGDFECARLEVPLDWTNLSNPNKVALAVIRLPAVVPHTNPTFGGTILLNPGGPGGSGVDYMLDTGRALRDIVGNEKHFELLSWDPRGVHFTTPSASCYTSEWQRQIRQYSDWAFGSLDSSTFSFDLGWAAAQAHAKLCGETEQGVYPDGSSLRQYVTTALSAHDMVAIIDQIDLHRDDSPDRGNSEQEPINMKEPALLQYWGLSYGTFLGNTFASMFPSRVGRMLLDANVDVDDYVSTAWSHNLEDNNRTLGLFYEYCFDAGFDCPLVSKHERSANDIAIKVSAFLDDLGHNPIPVVYNNTIDIVTHLDVVALIFSSLYTPYKSWQDLSKVLSDLLQGNTTSVLPYLQARLKMPAGSDGPPGHNRLTNQINPGAYYAGTDATYAILCSDGEDITYMTKFDLHRRIALLKSQSPLVGGLWVTLPMSCIHWPSSQRATARNRFLGPFSSRRSDYDPRSSPLLFIGNTADPVTPLRNAFKSASRHEDSQVLTQNTPGHGTGSTNPSTCTHQYIKAFFGNGTLPPNGTVCEGDSTPWGKPIAARPETIS